MSEFKGGILKGGFMCAPVYLIGVFLAFQTMMSYHFTELAKYPVL